MKKNVLKISFKQTAWRIFLCATPTFWKSAALLGRIEGKIDSIEKKQDEFGERLITVEKRSVKNATVCGAVVSLSFGILQETIKNKLGF